MSDAEDLIKVDLVLDTSGFKAGITEATTAAEKAGAQMANAFGDKMQTNIANAGTAAKNSAVTTTKMTVDDYVKMCKVSVEKAQEMFDKAAAKAKKTGKTITENDLTEEKKRAKKREDFMKATEAYEAKKAAKQAQKDASANKPAVDPKVANTQQPNAPPEVTKKGRQRNPEALSNAAKQQLIADDAKRRLEFDAEVKRVQNATYNKNPKETLLGNPKQKVKPVAEGADVKAAKDMNKFVEKQRALEAKQEKARVAAEKAAEAKNKTNEKEAAVEKQKADELAKVEKMMADQKAIVDKNAAAEAKKKNAKPPAKTKEQIQAEMADFNTKIEQAKGNNAKDEMTLAQKQKAAIEASNKLIEQQRKADLANAKADANAKKPKPQTAPKAASGVTPPKAPKASRLTAEEQAAKQQVEALKMEARQAKAAARIVEQQAKTDKALQNAADRMVRAQQKIEDSANKLGGGKGGKGGGNGSNGSNGGNGGGPTGPAGPVDPGGNGAAAASAVAIERAYTGSFANIRRAADTLRARFRNVFNDIAAHSRQTTENMGSYFKSLSRIVTGIMISQAFYKIFGAIKQATSAVYEFSKTMETAAIGFETMLGSAMASTAMINQLQDLAIKTPFTFETATLGAKRLLALGIQARDIKPTLTALSDAMSALGGTDAQMEALSLTFGKISAKGKISGIDVLALARNGIPAYAILREELGLTAKQMQNIGKQNISSAKALPALISGIEKRFGGLADKLSHTVTGLMSNIGDAGKYLGQMLSAPAFEKFRNFLQGIQDGLAKLVDIARQSGIGGVFESVIPKDMQEPVRRLIGYFRMLSSAIGDLFKASSINSIFKGMITTLSYIVQPIAVFVKGISILVGKLGFVTPALQQLGRVLGAFIAFRFVGTILAIISSGITKLTVATGAAKAIESLTKALNALKLAAIKNPITAIAVVAAMALMYLVSKTDAARAAMASFQDQMNAFFGVDTDSIFEPTDMSDEYAKQLADIIALQDASGQSAEDAAEQAADAAKLFSASFDEFHQIPDDKGDGSGGAGGGAGGGTGGGDVPKLPTVPDAATKPVSVPIDTTQWVWPVFPPFPPLPPLPMGSLSAQLKAAWAKVEEWFANPWPSWKKFPQFQPFPAFNPQPVLDLGWKKVKDWFKKPLPAWRPMPAFDYKPITDLGTFFNGAFEAMDRVSDAHYASELVELGIYYESASALIQTAMAAREVQLSMKGVKAAHKGALQEMATDLQASTTATAVAITTAMTATASQYSMSGVKKAHKGALGEMTNAWSIENATTKSAVAASIADVAFQFKMSAVKKAHSGAIADLNASWSGQASETKSTLVRSKGDILEAFKLSQEKTELQKSLGISKNLWANHKEEVLVVGGLLAAGVVLTFGSIPAGVAGAVATLPTVLSNLGPKITTAAQGLVNIISQIFNKVPALGITANVTNFSSRGTLPAFANGGVVYKDQIVRVGEGNKREAIIPLQNEQAMAPFAAAVAARLSGSFSGQPQQQQAPQQQQSTMYVGTLIADERSLKELERRMQVVRVQETQRKGGK